MYAVLKTGGKQYRVAANDILEVEKLPAEAGETIELGEVLMIGDGEATEVGAPLVEGARVAAEVLEQKRGKKVIVFKKKRRKNYRRTRGHRQDLTVLRIAGVLRPGETLAAAAPDTAPAEPVETAAPEPAAADGEGEA